MINILQESSFGQEIVYINLNYRILNLFCHEYHYIGQWVSVCHLAATRTSLIIELLKNSEMLLQILKGVDA